MKQADLSKLLKRFSSLFGARILGSILIFAVNLLIVRVWSEDVLGLFSILLAINAVLAQICSGGFTNIATMLTSKYVAMRKFGWLAGFQSHAYTIRLAGALLSFPISLAYLFWSTDYRGITLIILGLALAVSIFVSATLAFYSAVLVARDQQVRAIVPEVLLRPVLLLFAIIAVAALGWSVSADQLFILFGVVNIAVLLIIWRYMKISAAGNEIVPDFSQRGQWNRAAPPWIVTSLVWDFFVELQILVAGFLALPAQVAILHICFRFRMLAGFGMRALYSLLLPDIYAKHAKGADITAAVRRVHLLGTVYGLCVLLGFVIIGKPLLSLFGPSFTGHLDALLIVSSVVLVRGICGPTPALLAMYGSHLSSSIVMSFCLIGSVAAAPFAYSHWGITGLAGSYAAASIAGSVVLWIYLKILLRRRAIGEEA
ncbi:MAG: hypothetical protein AAGF25_02625 [Pseudomonadota bacterium]